MMKSKKFLSFILAFALIFTAMPTISLPADAASTGTTKGGCTWELNGTVLEIYGSGEMGSMGTPWGWGADITEVYIHYGVTSIGSYAFQNFTSLTKVTIPSSVKKIYWGAFENCTSLRSIALPNSITSICYDAFYGCRSLTTVVLPNKLTELGSGVFRYCTSLSSIEIPSTITEISDETFYSCNSLKNFTIPTSITSIGDDAFAYCRNLASITIPNTVTKIGDRAFSYCESISRITISNSDTNLGSGVFKGCTSLTQFTIPSGITELADSLFYGCSSLKNITIPNSVTSIGNYTFRDCSKLTEISIPSSVINIGKQAFYQCSSLTKINIPNGITSINDNTFSGCSSLTKIDIPKGVTSIGSGVFYDCSLLSEINIPEQVTLIKDHTFYNCSALKNISIPNGVTSIGNYAFNNCDSLKEINLPSSVTSIGNNAFNSCNSLKEINIPSSVTFIGSYAFCSCPFEEITIPNGVTRIEDAVFSGCSYLKEVTIPNGVTHIGTATFNCCTSIREIIIPNSVTSIGNSAFAHTNLTSITIPSSVTSLGKGAFNYCLGLTEVVILGNITAIEDETFMECSSLKTVVLPNSVKSIGMYAFNCCFSLTEILIPSEVELIESYAFEFCKSLEKVTLPNTVAEIQFAAFDYCSELDYVWYSGSEEDRNNISISYNNYAFTSSTWNYNVCETVHAYSADCDNSCLYCGNIRQTVAEHTYTNGFDTVCNSCGAIRNITDIISGNFTYKVSNGNATITGCKASVIGEIVVPKKIDGYTVTGIAENAFYNCGNITKITIQSNISNIGLDAFTRCFSLKRIEVSENNQNYCSQSGILYTKDKKTLICKPYAHSWYFIVNYLDHTGKKLFDSVEEELKTGDSYSAEIPGVDRYTTNIDSISGTISNEDVIINVIYYENPKLSSGKCNDNITWTLYEDGGLVFRGSGAMPDYTSSGAPWAQNADDVKEVYIDSRITSIGAYAFENCSNLTYIDYGYSISSIGKYAFSGCSSLTSFKLPNTVTTVSEGAFMGCSELGTVVISDNITAIGDKAFYDCQNLSKVTLGGAVTTVGSSAFDNCAKLNQIYFRGKPATLGSNALGSVSGKNIYYYSSVTEWSDAVSNGKWNGYSAYPYDLIAKEGFDGTNPYAVKVVDKHNTPLQGAIVQLGDVTGHTDKDGLAYFVKPTGSISLKITCSNHRDFTDEEFTASTNQAMDIIELSDKPSTVQGVRLDGKSIATSVETLNCNKEKTVNIAVNGYSKYTIVRYELHQGNRLIATNKTSASSTTFSVKTTAFEEGETVFVEMYTSDGGVVAAALNIDVIKLADISESQILSELSNIELSIGLGSMGSYKIPLTFESSGDEKFYTSVKGRTIRVGINLDIAEFFEKDDGKAYKTEIQNMVDKSMKNFAKGKPGFESNVCGYLEIEYLGNGEYIVKTSYVKVGVAAKLGFNAQASYFGVVGVYFKAELKGEATLDMHITHYAPEDGFKVDDLNFAMENTLTLDGGAYLLWGIGSAGIYGKAQMGFVLGIIPEVEFESVYITGEIGVKWSVLWGLYTGNHKFLSGDIYRWPEAQTYMLRSVRPAVFAIEQDPDSYEFNDRSYLENRSEWLNGDYLQKNIYDNVAPKIVTCGDTTIMVWLDDNSSRADADFQTLYYSVLQNGAWSSPVAVCDNGTFDCEFDVYTDGEKIYVVYTEMTAQNTGIEAADVNSEDGFASFVNGVEVSVIVFDDGKFGSAKQITDNDICEILPRISLLDGKITAIWSESASVGLNTNASGNSVYSAVLQQGVWSAPDKFVGNQNIMSDITAVNLADGSFIAYIVDSDNSGETNDDQALIICDTNGNSIQVDSGLIMNVETAKIAGKNALVWYNNGKIYMITESTSSPVCLVPESVNAGTNYQIISISENDDLLTFAMGNTDTDGNSVDGSDIYAVYINESGCLTAPVRLTETSGYVQNYSVCHLDGKLVTVFTETFADVSGDTVETTTNLRNTELEFCTDIKLNSVDFDILSAKSESALELTLNISNKGTVGIDGFTVNIYDKAGGLVATVISQTALESGETSDAVISFILPNGLSVEGYIVEVLPLNGTTSIDDAKPSDNTKEINLTYADIEVSAEQKIIGEKNYIILTVKNNGNVESKVELKLYAPDTNGELLSHIKSEEAIAPGEMEVYTIELDSSVENVITCLVESKVNDPFALNNLETLTIFKLNEDVFVTDPDEVSYNPELSFTTAYFDKRDPFDIYFFIEECAEYFSGISGLSLNNEYTLSDDLVCIKKEYLSSLEVGKHTLQIVFDFGNGNIIERTLDMNISDTRPIALEGSVSIIGETLVGETVYADVSGVNANSSYYSVEWYIDGAVVGTGSSYTIKTEDNAKRLSLRVQGKNGYSGTLSAGEYITLRKPEAPAAPIVISVTSDSVTLAKIDSIEFSRDLTNWQDSGVFEDLAPNKTYHIYARKKATETSFASELTSVSFTTLKKVQTLAPVAPVFESKDHCSITLLSVAGAEYKIEGGEWTDNNVFENLSPNTTYKFYQRYKETDDIYAGEIATANITTEDKIAISGSIKLVGVAEYGQTLTVYFTEFEGDIGSVVYQWYCDGVAISGATSCNYQISVNDMGKEISVTVCGTDAYKGELVASVTVKDYVTGDINGDNIVTILDATILSRYVAKWESVTINNELAADVNHDGIVNIRDVTILRRYVAKWEGYESLF